VERTQPSVHVDRAEMLEQVIGILQDITSDWDLEFEGGIGPETLLITNLEFESIDVVQFVVALEERFGRRDLPFEKLLMVDDTHVNG
jgi:acyl carrier protein